MRLTQVCVRGWKLLCLRKRTRPKIRPILILLFLCSLPWPASATRIVVSVVDSISGEPIEDVEVRVLPDTRQAEGAVSVTSFTDAAGLTRLSLAPGRWRLRLRQGAFAQDEHRLRVAEHTDTLRIYLRRIAYRLAERLAVAIAAPSPPGVTTIAPVELRRYPTPTADPVRIARVLPGVAAAGDQAPSSYHVRGGSFDENLVYIEGVEVQAPLMLRNGLGETMSLVNGDLVGDLAFHAGVLPAHLGDALSSVIDVHYRRPDSLEIALRGGATQQAATLSARAGRLSWIAGVRRADLGRLARDLQTSGDVAPEYGDVQALVLWRGEKIDGHLFGVSARSGLVLQPSFRQLRDDCIDFRPDRGAKIKCGFIGDALGVENFEYDTDLVGVQLTTPFLRWRLRWQGSAVKREEREDTDLSFFADWASGSPVEAPVSDWLETRQIVDGKLDQSRLETAISLLPDHSDTWELGVGLRQTDLDANRLVADTLWLDGRQLPATAGEAEVDRRLLNRWSYMRINWQPGAFIGGWEARALHVDASDEWLLLPRARLGRQHGRFRWVMAVGMSAQTAQYKQLLASGAETPDAQKGADAYVEIEHQRERWRIRGTVFGRRGWDRISWTMDDVEVRYAPTNDSRTRAWGTEWMMRGQVGRAVGLVTYSFLDSEENLTNDGAGWVPTASDQRHTATAYLEDQMDLRIGWMRASRFHIRFLYGSGFPFTSQLPLIDDSQIVGFALGERHARRDDPYTRFDVGMTQVFSFGGFELEVREEVANLFDEFNVVGYRQLPAPDGSMSLLPRGLGRRVYNGEVSVRF
ncbi:MAG: TonB-dependent receptor [Gemmatimonadetes bacterium]|jgi:hypothetical protein|nr:TonB-dependent receptor [Gemmatimonadota bacterium]MBT5055243.1 TonB-dependent receptor [Gemmatimonadota bacterium]MBT5141781.1 TonB-dependent receptor [Gemmatimonadota bacterium]MBT5591084.1 TonB-dependent receptor [Gemmatimonadota bacterium]MBT5962850.1 TonB-dependent receptor [Gemmatimonadota bacterium]